MNNIYIYILIYEQYIYMNNAIDCNNSIKNFAVIF